MDYLRLKGWSDKIYSMPEFPRGNNFIESLYTHLEEFKNNNLEEKIALRLRANGFLLKDENNSWKLTDISSKILNTGNNELLFEHLSNTVVFFGEILYLLKQDSMNIGRLLEIANDEYLIVNWKKKNQIYTRLQWMRDLGIVEYFDFENLYKINNTGLVYLETIIDNFELRNKIQITEPDEIMNNIPNWIFESEKKDLDNLGYIAGSKEDYLITIKETIRLIQNEQNDLSDFTASPVFSGLKEKSIKHHIKTLTDMGLIERQSLTSYKLTAIGGKVLSLNDFQFVFYLDKICTFVLEILLYLNRKPQTLKELTAIPKEKYSVNKDSMSKRLNFLEVAKLIYKVDYYTYATSDLGKSVLSYFNIKSSLTGNNIEINENDIDIDSSTPTDPINSLIIELRQAASDSTMPSRFEKVINECFINLGYDSKWLGKSGETDVLAQTKTAPVSQYKIIIDAKSTSSPTVSNSLIDFDTLKEHKQKYNADYIVVVGIKFDNGRVVKRANEHEVALLDVDALADLLKNHRDVPLGYKEYEKIFSKGGIANLDSLAEDRDQLIYQKKLVYSVLEVLTEERDDPVTKGEMSARDIYIMLKMNQSLGQSPTLHQIKGALEFLSSSFIRGVEKTKNGYSATGSVTEISNILNFLSR